MATVYLYRVDITVLSSGADHCCVLAAVQCFPDDGYQNGERQADRYADDVYGDQ